MQRRKTGGISLLGFCVLMGIPTFALAADQHKETVTSVRSTERHLANIQPTADRWPPECGGLFFI
jgi:hypothetical protein